MFLGRVPVSRSWILIVMLILFFYGVILYWTTVTGAALYPDITFGNWYTFWVMLFTAALGFSIGYGSYCWRRYQEPYTVQTLTIRQQSEAENLEEAFGRDLR